MTQESQIMPKIIIVIEQNGGEIEGSENLALEIGTAKHYVLKCARRLHRIGLITICPSCGGRGRKTKYISGAPGLPRKQRDAK